MTDIKIYQIYYRNDQFSKLDESFIPYDNSNDKKLTWAEYSVFLKEYLNNIHQHSDYTGFVSYRFYEKTKLSGKQFIDFINENEGYDVYFINFYPLYNVKSVWEQGEFGHKGITKFTQGIFDKLGYNIELKNIFNDESNTLFANFWVGNKFFWNEYINFTRPIYNYINNKNNLTEIEKKFIKRKTFHHLGGGNNVRFKFSEHPFVMERLFSTLLNYNKKIRSLAYRYSEIEKKLQNEYWGLYFNFNGVERENEKLKYQYNELSNKYNEVEKNNEKLKYQYNELSNKYYDIVKSDIWFITKKIEHYPLLKRCLLILKRCLLAILKWLPN